jgi:hypothetical protein
MTTFIISAWIKASASGPVDSGDPYETIVGAWPLFWFFIINQSPNVGVYLGNCNAAFQVGANTDLEDGKWHQVTVSVRPTPAKSYMYIDGHLAGSGTMDFTGCAMPGSWGVGDKPGIGDYFNGNIMDVFMYTSAIQ